MEGSLIGQSLEGYAPKDFAAEHAAWLTLDAALSAATGVSIYRLGSSLLRPKPEGVWLLGDRERGLLLEEGAGGNLPPGFKMITARRLDIGDPKGCRQPPAT